MKPLYFEHEVSHEVIILSTTFQHFAHNISLIVSAFCTIAQCICAFWT